MTKRSVEELEQHYDEFIAHTVTLDEVSQGLSRAELRAAIHTGRAALKDALGNLPDRAFASQPNDLEGNEVWSAGQVVTHCNGEFTFITNQVTELTGLDGFEVSDDLERWSEQRDLFRGEAMQAIDVLPIDQLMDSIPADADLEAYDESDSFGKMPARAWLYFLAVHEAEHAGQLHELMEA